MHPAGEERDLVLNSEWDREPVQSVQDGGDVIVLFILKPLDASLARDPDEESITVIPPGGDKGMDGLLCICQGGLLNRVLQHPGR